MKPDQLKQMRRCAEDGRAVDEETALAVLRSRPVVLPEILAAASLLKHRFFKERLLMCSIMNIKCGGCSEDCAFCAQSAQHNTAITFFNMRSAAEMRKAYKTAVARPIKHFGVVASGETMQDKDVAEVCLAVKDSPRGRAAWCASLGSLPREQLRVLKGAGLRRYHQNLETAESYFANICSTHTFADRLATIRRARDAGFEVCSGCILGMGESLEQRVEIALTLAREQVQSIPLNFLIPIPGTPLEKVPAMKPLEIIRCIAMFRLLNPTAEIKICAGRGLLGSLQPLIFHAGATGMMLGSLLTTPSRDVEQDLQMLKDLELE